MIDKLIEIKIPVAKIKELSNDQELGRYVRTLYYSLKPQENADQKRNAQSSTGKN